MRGDRVKKELKVRAFSQDCRAAKLPKIRARMGGGGGGCSKVSSSARLLLQ